MIKHFFDKLLGKSSGARQPRTMGAVHDLAVQRAVMGLVVLADVDRQPQGGSFELHESRSFPRRRVARAGTISCAGRWRRAGQAWKTCR